MRTEQWGTLLFVVAMLPFVMQMSMLAYFKLNPDFLGDKEGVQE